MARPDAVQAEAALVDATRLMLHLDVLLESRGQRDEEQEQREGGGQPVDDEDRRADEGRREVDVPQGNDLQGEIAGLVGPYLTGWACRASALDEQLWIEVRVDNTPLTVCRADQFHVRAQARGLGDGCYGFWLRLPDSVLSSDSSVSLHVANTGDAVGMPVSLDRLEDRHQAMGQVFSDGGVRLSGWLRDPDNDATIMEVRCVLDGEELIRVKAEQRRNDPRESDGHGFAVTLPFALLGGAPRLVDVLDAAGRHLPGSPVMVHAVVQGASAWLGSLQHPKPAQIRLLTTLLARYEHWFPKSAGLEMYDQWLKAFPPEAVKGDADKQVGVVVLPGGDDGNDLRGLVNQKYARFQIWSPGREGAAGKKALAGREDASAAVAARLRKCDYLLLVRPGFVLEKSALANLVAGALRANAEVVYCDGALVGPDGCIHPRLKPAWDKYLFHGHDYLDGPLLVDARLFAADPSELEAFAAALLTGPAGVDPEEAWQRLRMHVLMTASPGGIKHLPVPLYSGPLPTDAEAGRRALLRRDLLQAWLDRADPGARADIQPDYPATIRVRRPLSDFPLVSLIIPTRDRLDLLRPCITSIMELTTYRPYELLVVDNGSREPETAAYFAELRDQGVGIIPYPQAFNYAAMNNLAAERARGELLCLLNNDLELLTPDWLEEMVALMRGEAAGCVGAKLIWPNNLVQHGGVVTGVHQLAAHVGNDWLAEEPGYLYRNQVVGRWSAVTAACLLTRRADYLRIGGMDAVSFPVTFNDVDYCLKLAQEGREILWTPHARFLHHESASRGKDDTPAKQALAQREMHRLRHRWGERLLRDPFHNPNLSLSTYVGVFDGLALPPGQRSIR